MDLTGSEGRPLVVVGEARGFSSEPLEDVVDERVHDGHGLLGDAGLGVHLLEDTVDVDGESLGSLLLGGSSLDCSLAAGSGCLSGSLLCHDVYFLNY